MKNIKFIKKHFIIFAFMIILLSSNYLLANDIDNIAPTVNIQYSGSKNVHAGDTLVFNVTFSDNIRVATVDLNSSLIYLNGFSGSATVSGNGNNSRKITIYNISGVGKNKSITIGSGAILDDDINMSESVTSATFNILSNSSNNSENSNNVNNTTTKDSKKVNNSNNNSDKYINNKVNINNIPNINSESGKNKLPSVQEENKDSNNNSNTQENVINNLKLSDVGILNEKFNTSLNDFAFWIKSKRIDSVSTPQENNYAAKDKEMEYIIEYYNGKNQDINDAAFYITMPENVTVEEINGNGKYNIQSDQTANIEWNVPQIKSHQGYYLYVKVKFSSDEDLEKSKNISRVFYVRAQTKIDNKIENSYIRQLFIDTNAYKKIKLSSNYLFVDPYDISRPNDKITRIELIKMLIDYGVFNSDNESKKYVNYKDYKDIDYFYRDTLSVAYKTNVISVYSNNLFKPNNPILKDEFLSILAKVLYVISDQKLSVNQPLYTYDDIMKYNSEVSSYKNEIMELIRQNIISNENININEYITRKEALKYIISLSLNGPFNDKLPDSNVKFINKYFYDIDGLLNTCYINYDGNLHQNIVK